MVNGAVGECSQLAPKHAVVVVNQEHDYVTPHHLRMVVIVVLDQVITSRNVTANHALVSLFSIYNGVFLRKHH
jgi:hypothetical protein